MSLFHLSSCLQRSFRSGIYMLLMNFRHKQKGTQQQAEEREESVALSLLVQSNPSERTKHAGTPNSLLDGSANQGLAVVPFREPPPPQMGISLKLLI